MARASHLSVVREDDGEEPTPTLPIYRYHRERADGKHNDTVSRKTFEKWLREIEDGDRFWVAKCHWVECEHDRMVAFGDGDLPHVSKVCDFEGKDNG